MYEIIYLNTEDRVKLEQAQTKLMRASSDEERSLLHAEIADIESRKKNLRDCNHEECLALKVQLFDKLQKFNKIGRASQARQFNVMLQTVDFRIRMLALEVKKEEIEKKAEQKSEKVLAAERRKQRREQNSSAKSVWSIKIDDDDDD